MEGVSGKEERNKELSDAVNAAASFKMWSPEAFRFLHVRN